MNPDRPQTTLDDSATLTEWCRHIMLTADPDLKVDLTFELGKRWREGVIKEIGKTKPPDEPARPDHLDIVKPGYGNKVGKGLTLQSRLALLHSLANVEQCAIDTALDNIAHFYTLGNGKLMPRRFIDDMILMACEEAKHFKLLVERMSALGSTGFGSFPVHQALWDSCAETSSCPTPLCRFTLVHLLHEARGLDLSLSTIDRFRKPLVASHGKSMEENGDIPSKDPASIVGNVDTESVKMLELIFNDELGHVEMGRRWFEYVWKQGGRPYDGFVESAVMNDDNNSQTQAAIQQTFKETVRKHYKGGLKGPFNEDARNSAGLTTDWYGDLVDYDQ